MNANSPYQSAAVRSVGALSEMCTNAAVLLLCAALVTLAMTASLLLTLPNVLDAVASTRADVSQVDERQPGQMVADWVDALADGDLATWRLRSSD